MSHVVSSQTGALIFYYLICMNIYTIFPACHLLLCSTQCGSFMQCPRNVLIFSICPFSEQVHLPKKWLPERTTYSQKAASRKKFRSNKDTKNNYREVKKVSAA